MLLSCSRFYIDKWLECFSVLLNVSLFGRKLGLVVRGKIG